jgi:hypothetical protein
MYIIFTIICSLAAVVSLCITNAAPHQKHSHGPENSYALLASVESKRVNVQRTVYHGWPDSLIISNDRVEAVVVPTVGRVMQFRFVGEEGVFWENEASRGKSPTPEATTWSNFGGDKAWPAPQTDWPRITNRAWPPPIAFDSLPVIASVHDDASVELLSPVDPAYGIRIRRRIRLDPQQTVMKITTTFEKVAGSPQRVGVWIVTQVRDPLGVYLRVPQSSIYPAGYNKQSPGLPKDLRVKNGLLSLVRDSQANHKIGSDAGTLVWVGATHVLRIDSSRTSKAEYPDGGSSVEVYTNKDPQAYVELEVLGPLSTMRVGDRIEETSAYTLLKRTEKDPTIEATKALKNH